MLTRRRPSTSTEPSSKISTVTHDLVRKREECRCVVELHVPEERRLAGEHRRSGVDREHSERHQGDGGAWESRQPHRELERKEIAGGRKRDHERDGEGRRGRLQRCEEPGDDDQSDSHRKPHGSELTSAQTLHEEPGPQREQAQNGGEEEPGREKGHVMRREARLVILTRGALRPSAADDIENPPDHIGAEWQSSPPLRPDDHERGRILPLATRLCASAADGSYTSTCSLLPRNARYTPVGLEAL